MTDIAPISLRARTISSTRPLAGGLLVTAAIVLWLLFLPVLMTRTGMASEEQGCRLSATYRDPVIGRTVHASRPAVPLAPCPGFGP